MKRCPECRRDYYDDSLLYCLDDGTALLEGPGSGEAMTQTIPVPGEAATKRHDVKTDELKDTTPSSSAEVLTLSEEVKRAMP